jgi:glycerol-3-phosphate dehydrogenase (NAD(P)+)
MEDVRLARHHDRIRTRGVNRPVYFVARLVLVPLLRLWFRLGRTGREHIPREGAVILAANHRSFLDPFVIGCCVRRPFYFVAKRELFERRFAGWLLNALGAFPIRRGDSDEEAMATARAVLERGDALVIFPEGTRIRSGALGNPRRGVGRLALETGAPVVPIAIRGSEHARRGIVIRPAKVSLRIGRPLTFPRLGHASGRLAGEVTARIWPCVELQWEWLGGLPPLRRAAVVGAGSMGTALAVLLARAGLEVQLGTRTAAQAERLAAARRNDAYLPGVELPAEVDVRPAGELELVGCDLVVLAVPARGLPAAVAQAAARIGERSAVLVLSKGVVAPHGQLPSDYVGERVRARAIGCLAGPAHAREAVEAGASIVLATRDRDLAAQLSGVLERAGLSVERTDDVVGTELAACAKNVAALAAAAAAVSGPNAAGAVAGRVFAELHEHARTRGGRSETFVGLAGTGDLVATALAHGSRNRRAGELLGQGAPGARVEALVGQAVEAVDAVPLLARSLELEGTRAPAIGALAALVDGRMGPDEWIAGVHSRPGTERRAA